MARTSRSARSKKKSSVRVDLSKVGKQLEAEQWYHFKVSGCEVKDGDSGPYFALELSPVDEEFSSSKVYVNLSTSEGALWRLRAAMEAFGMEIPDGPMDIGPEDFVDMEAEGFTYLDRYEGKSRIRVEDLRPVDGEGGDESEDFDLDELDDDTIKALADALDVEGKTVASLKKSLKKLDQDDVKEAYESLSEDEPEPKTRRRPGKAKADEPEDEDEDEDEKPKTRGKKPAGKTKKKETVSEEEVMEMSEDDLEELIEKHELEVDIGEFKTLRKKQNAVIDALEEAGLIEE